MQAGEYHEYRKRVIAQALVMAVARAPLVWQVWPRAAIPDDSLKLCWIDGLCYKYRTCAHVTEMGRKQEEGHERE